MEHKNTSILGTLLSLVLLPTLHAALCLFGCPFVVCLFVCLFVCCIQLFRQRLFNKSVKAYATMPIGIMGSMR